MAIGTARDPLKHRRFVKTVLRSDKRQTTGSQEEGVPRGTPSQFVVDSPNDHRR